MLVAAQLIGSGAKLAGGLGKSVLSSVGSSVGNSSGRFRFRSSKSIDSPAGAERAVNGDAALGVSPITPIKRQSAA